MSKPSVFTKELSVPRTDSRSQSRVRISSNLLLGHGFTPGSRVTKAPRVDGAGFEIRLNTTGEQQVYSRGYSNSPRREALIEVGDQDWVSRLMGAIRVQIVSRPGIIKVIPVPDYRFNVITRARKATDMPMFSVLSSGICAHAFHSNGFRAKALCEWRPPEKRDLASGRDLSETGAASAIANVPFESVINQDIFTLNDFILAESLGDTSITLLAGSLQCDSFSNLKSATLKAQNRESGESGDAELFYPLLKVVEKVQPAVIFIENVPAFLNSEIGGVFKAVLRRLGYYINQATLNGADYGTRCSRPRGFIVASVWPGFAFPSASGRAVGSLFDWLGTEMMDSCRDITGSNIVSRAIAKNRLRATKADSPTAPVFPKSQARVVDRVFFHKDGRYLDPSIPVMRKIHGIPSGFDMSHLPSELQIEQIGQGVDYVLVNLIAESISRHVQSNIRPWREDLFEGI
jgi:DNA (cytosine-5)-methyltransferase 1